MNDHDKSIIDVTAQETETPKPRRFVKKQLVKAGLVLAGGAAVLTVIVLKFHDNDE